MDNRGETWKTLLVSIPVLAATLVAVSRIMDARHHPFDVITGSMLGAACAWLSYHQYFPPLSEAWRKGRAYPIRTWGTEPVNPLNAKFAPLNESTEPLRNPESEQLAPSHAPQRSASPAQFPTSTGYANPAYNGALGANPRRLHDHHPDGNWSSSEEDVGNGYEMQPGYAMAQNPMSNPYAQPFENTAYPPQTHAPNISNDLHSSGGVVGHAATQPGMSDVPIQHV